VSRRGQAVLKAQVNKTDRNDARGMAQMMRVGLYRPVHIKTLRSQKLRIAAYPSPTASVEGDRHPLSCGASCSEREAAAGSAEHELLGNLFFGQIDEVLAAAMHRHYICKIELPEL